MLFGAIVTAAVGILLTVFGYLIWKKQKIALLHEYHYKNVKPEDVPAYTRLIGIGQIVIGAGLCLTGVLQLFSERLWVWIPFVLCLIAGTVVLDRAQRTYNGSWFG